MDRSCCRPRLPQSGARREVSSEGVCLASLEQAAQSQAARSEGRLTMASGAQITSVAARWYVNLGTALALLVLFGTNAGCASPMRFTYLSLENEEDVEVTMRGKPEFKHTLIFESEFPTHYQLRRAEYTLEFSIETTKFSPHIWIQAIGPTGVAFQIKSRADRLPKGGRVHQCGT